MNLIHRQPAPAITLQLLACLVIVVLPHTGHLQPWIWLGFGILVAWRAVAALRHWPMPSRAIRMLLGGVAFIAVYLTYGRINGQEGGVALLVILLGVKLTELNSFRDHVVVAVLSYFVLISQFLFSQELVMILWLAAGALIITTTLLSISHPQYPLPLKTSMKRSAALLLQAAPLMLICFVLFPRIPGPLWGIPSNQGNARSGLSDSMTPGDIASLVSTDEIAFRAQFYGAPPTTAQMYWRGPVFEVLKGRTWTSVKYDADDIKARPPPPSIDALENYVDYQVTLEPHQQHWLFLLDMPTEWSAQAEMRSDGQVMTRDKLSERQLYTARSALDYRLEPALSPEKRARNLYLPAERNPRTLAQASSWRSEGLDDVEIIKRILSIFREEEYVYTLQPPRLGANSVDEFLFDTRRGFCEHYASSFTYFMRAAGIPARVVTGYQGGEYNELGDYYIVSQSDAHAWTEVWLENEGWVRVDPTGAVAPERIELGLEAALPLSDNMLAALARRRGDGLLRNLRLRWDWVNNSWYRWVLGYGPELQEKLLSQFGIKGWGRMFLALTVLATAFLGGLGLMLVWQMQRRPGLEPIQKTWALFSQKFKPAGMQRQPQEGPLDYLRRLANRFPDQAEDIRKIVYRYTELRYGSKDVIAPEDQEELHRWVKNFKPRPLQA